MNKNVLHVYAFCALTISPEIHFRIDVSLFFFYHKNKYNNITWRYFVKKIHCLFLPLENVPHSTITRYIKIFSFFIETNFL